MSMSELDLLCVQIRDFLIDEVSKTGGHLASNLGVVELSVGLHRKFDSPRDKIIWDVGHQSYVHKILTGRAADFDNLRQNGGMSGFPKSSESEHDVYDTGHSSSSLAAAAGMAKARDLSGEDHNVIAVIGDGSMTGGPAYEALNNIGASKSKVIIILNDNGMSISRNIGGMSRHLSKLRASGSYLSAKKNIKNTLFKIPAVGRHVARGLSEIRDNLKYALIQEGIIFEELGFTYLGPIDGHDLNQVLDGLEQTKHINGPVILHAITKKGKGYHNAECDPGKFHGIAPFDKETGQLVKLSGTTYSEVMGESLLRLAKNDDRIVALTAAMRSATGLDSFAARYPARCLDVGIAEACAVTYAAGLAKGGYKPVVAIYSTFLQRAYDQIMEDVCLQNLPVTFVIDRAGIVGADGETHHGIFDIAYLSSMPNMKILAPSGEKELTDMLSYALGLGSPCAIRYPRGECPLNLNEEGWDGTAMKRIAEGEDCDLAAEGNMLKTAMLVRRILTENGIDIGVLKVSSLKPLYIEPITCEIENNKKPEDDFEVVVDTGLDTNVDPDNYMVKNGKTLFTIEDGVISGGFGQRLSAELSGRNKVISFGWPDAFIEHGSCDYLYEKYGLDAKSISDNIIAELKRTDN